MALERTSELLKAASSNVLRFKIDGELPAAVRRQGARHRPHRAAARRTTRTRSSNTWPSIREAGLRVEDVEIRKADLEDVFLDVMAQHRDAGRRAA